MKKKGCEVEVGYIPRGKRYWIPMLGWVFLQAWAMKNNARKAFPVVVIHLLLLVFSAVVFFEISPTFTSSEAQTLPLLVILAFSLFVIAGTAFEVNYVDGHRQTASGLSGLLNWDLTKEMPRNEIWRHFLSSNYHEVVLAIVGMILGVELRA